MMGMPRTKFPSNTTINFVNVVRLTGPLKQWAKVGVDMATTWSEAICDIVGGKTGKQ